MAVFGLGFFAGYIVREDFSHKPPSAAAVYPAKEIYFSPEGRIQQRLTGLIHASKRSIDIAIFDLTAEPLAKELIAAQRRGVKVRMVADKRQAKGQRSLIPLLIESGMNIVARGGHKGGIMHNKFAIFDGETLFTGSYNWTANAEYRNFENAVFTTDKDIIFAYQKEFEILWER